ncbi:MAG: ABC transporter substrate-binding protein, partial [Ramlibacter sp.]
IKKDNPNMTDEQLAYSVAKLKEMGIIASGDARTGGIGYIDEGRAKQNYAFLVDNKLIDGSKLKVEDAYKLDAVKAAKVLP